MKMLSVVELKLQKKNSIVQEGNDRDGKMITKIFIV